MEGDESSMCSDQVTTCESVEPIFDDFNIDIMIAWLSMVAMDMSLHSRELIRDSILSRPEWIMEILQGHSDRIYEYFRMEKHVFLNLCDLMKARGWLKDS